MQLCRACAVGAVCKSVQICIQCNCAQLVQLGQCVECFRFTPSEYSVQLWNCTAVGALCKIVQIFIHCNAELVQLEQCVKWDPLQSVECILCIFARVPSWGTDCTGDGSWGGREGGWGRRRGGGGWRFVSTTVCQAAKPVAISLVHIILHSTLPSSHHWFKFWTIFHHLSFQCAHCVNVRCAIVATIFQNLMRVIPNIQMNLIEPGDYKTTTKWYHQSCYFYNLFKYKTIPAIVVHIHSHHLGEDSMLIYMGWYAPFLYGDIVNVWTFGHFLIFTWSDDWHQLKAPKKLAWCYFETLNKKKKFVVGEMRVSEEGATCEDVVISTVCTFTVKVSLYNYMFVQCTFLSLSLNWRYYHSKHQE